jgi:4-amino-4-deoxy-L-arabinose transferase-like glycosyltransferase
MSARTTPTAVVRGAVSGVVARLGGRGIAVALLLGIGVRAIRLAMKWNVGLLFNDSYYYSAQATQLAHGVFFHEVFTTQQGAEHGPLTPVVLALVSWMHSPVAWQRLGTAVFGAVTVPLIGLLGKRVGGARVGVTAAVIAALYPNLWANDALVMSESLAALLMTIALLCLVAWVDAPSTRRLVAVGVALGLCALTRSELALAVPFVALLVVLVRRRQTRRWWSAVVMLGVSFAAPIAPWVVFNAARFERPVLLTTNEGPALLGTNCDEVYYGPNVGDWSFFCVVQGTPDRPYADTSVRSEVQRSVGLHYARSHLRRVPVVVATRVARLFDLYGLRNLVFQDVGEERQAWVSWAGIVCFWVLAPLAALGLRRVARRHLAVLLIPVAAAVLTSMMLYGAHRMRIGAEPVVVVGAAMALTEWWQRARAGIITRR